MARDVKSAFDGTVAQEVHLHLGENMAVIIWLAIFLGENITANG